jgi:hypothetical protein
MSRPLLLISLLFGLSASAQPYSGAPPPSAPPPSSQVVSDLPDSAYHKAGSTPAWLPRGAFLGTYLRRGVVTPQLRLQWQVTFFEDRKDALVLVLDGGVGYAVAFPSTALEGYDIPINAFHENTITAGLGYRNQGAEGFHWGFQVTGGPLWYGAQLTNVPDEHYTAGIVEGRIHLGYTFGPTVLGVSIGYGEPFSYRKRSVSRLFPGGVLLGFFADWR